MTKLWTWKVNDDPDNNKWGALGSQQEEGCFVYFLKFWTLEFLPEIITQITTCRKEQLWPGGRLCLWSGECRRHLYQYAHVVFDGLSSV